MVPVSTLVASLSEPLVMAILGKNWQPAVPLLAPLVFMITATVIAEPTVTTLTLLGRVKLLAALDWFAAFSVIIVMVVAAQLGDLEHLAFARTALAVALLILYLGWVRTALAISWYSLMGCFYRPVVASLVMGFVTISIAEASFEPWITIALAVPAGGMAYVVMLYGLWRSSSSPESGEAMLVRKFSLLAGHIFKRPGR